MQDHFGVRPVAQQERDALAALKIARLALRSICDHEGKVCEKFETCHHTACQSSYAAWAIADAALKGDK